MKKILALFLTAGLVIGMLAGCASGQDPEPKNESSIADTTSETQEPVTLTYWQHSSAARDEMMTSLVEQFEEQNKNLKVELEFIPEKDYSQKLIPALATANAPDVFQTQSGMVAKLAEAGAIQPLDESVMPSENIENEFIPATVNGMKYNDQFYGMPTDTQTMLTFWNKKLVAQEGLDAENGPQTWDEFFDWARKLTKYDENGAMIQSGWGGKGYWPEVESYVVQMGGKFYDAENRKFVFADDEKAVKAIMDMVALYKEDKVYDIEFSKNWAGFRQDLVGLMLGHPAMMGNLPVTAPDLDWGVALIPANGDSRATCVTSWSYVMSAKAPSVEATRFIEFLSSETVEKEWTLKTGELPARKALLEDTALHEDPKLKVALSSLDDSFVGSLQTSALNTIFTEMYEKLRMTDEPADQVLKAGQDALNEELANTI